MVLLFVRRWLALGLLLACLLGVLGAAACNGSTTAGLVPITGVLVRSETLTATHGCGAGPTNVFKYSVVVFGLEAGKAGALRNDYTVPLTANVFDCYVDGTFVKLPPTNGSTTYRLEVFAWTQSAYVAKRDQIEGAGTNLVQLEDSLPTWTTTCDATQADQVETVANCDPLTPAGGGPDAGATEILVDTSQVFHLPDGRSAICASLADGGVLGPSDAGDAGDADAGDADAGDADASDAGDAADADAGDAGVVTFTSARIRYRVGATVGPSVDLACPQIFRAEVSAEPVTYAVDVGLVDGFFDDGGTTIGIVSCTVTSQTGASSTAVCP